MIYLIDSFDFDLINIADGGDFMNFVMWETTEERVKRIIANERCRSIFSRNEIIKLFKTGKIQMVRCDKITLQPFDRIVVWTEALRYFVIEVTSFEKANEESIRQTPSTHRQDKKEQKSSEYLAHRIEVVEEGAELG